MFLSAWAGAGKKKKTADTNKLKPKMLKIYIMNFDQQNQECCSLATSIFFISV